MNLKACLKLPGHPLAWCYSYNRCTLRCSVYVTIYSSPDFGNNKHNSEINAHNSVKKQQNMLPYGHCVCLPAHPDARIFLGLLWPVKPRCTGPVLVCEGPRKLASDNIKK